MHGDERGAGCQGLRVGGGGNGGHCVVGVPRYFGVMRMFWR